MSISARPRVLATPSQDMSMPLRGCFLVPRVWFAAGRGRAGRARDVSLCGRVLGETQSVLLEHRRVLGNPSQDPQIRLCVSGGLAQGLEMRRNVHSVLSRDKSRVLTGASSGPLAKRLWLWGRLCAKARPRLGWQREHDLR
jgi:hypothetical protein